MNLPPPLPPRPEQAPKPAPAETKRELSRFQKIGLIGCTAAGFLLSLDGQDIFANIAFAADGLFAVSAAGTKLGIQIAHGRTAQPLAPPALQHLNFPAPGTPEPTPLASPRMLTEAPKHPQA